MLLHEKEWSMHERRVMREYKNTNKKKKDADKRLTESVGGQCLWCKGRKCQRERCLSCMESLPSISEACMSCTTNKSLYWRAGGIEREREKRGEWRTTSSDEAYTRYSYTSRSSLMKQRCNKKNFKVSASVYRSQEEGNRNRGGKLYTFPLSLSFSALVFTSQLLFKFILVVDDKQ